MLRTILVAVGIIALPTLVFVCAGKLMMEISGMNSELRKRGAEIPQSLAQRWLGYGEMEAKEYWSALKHKGLVAQERFLRIDLFFALLVASAIAFGTVCGWMELGRPWTVFIFLIPVFLYLLGDWTETSLHLRAVSHLLSGGSEASVDTGSIRLSGYATIVKWWSAIAAAFVLLAISFFLFVRHFKSS